VGGFEVLKKLVGCAESEDWKVGGLKF
jgi:hypothetical protein